MAFDETQFDSNSFWTLIRKVVITIVEYMKSILLEPIPKTIVLDPANIDIVVEPNNIQVELEKIMSCLGSSYTVKATFKDENGSLVDPESHYILLLDSRENVIHKTVSAMKLSLGVFKVIVPIPEDGRSGVWGICWGGVLDGENIPLRRHNFWVNEKC